MRKAQGSLEYLIIIAAVLAVAAVVVMFLTGALGGATAGGNIAQCRVTAAGCLSDIQNFGSDAATGFATSATCLSACATQCVDASDMDLLTGVAPVDAAGNAVYHCKLGEAASI